MANDAFLDALALEIVTTGADQAILDALALEIVTTGATEARLDGLAVEVVWTGTGILTQSIDVEQIDIDTGQFDGTGTHARAMSLKDDGVTADKLGFLWREVEIEASKFQYDASTRSYYTVTTGPRADNAPVAEQPSLLRNGVGDMTLAASTSSAQEWSMDGPTVAVHGDVTATGDTFSLRYITHGVLKNAALLTVDTTNATPTVMTTDGAAVALSNVLRLEDDSTLLCRVYVVGRRTDGNDESAGYCYEVLIDRNTGVATTALVGSVRERFVAEDNAGWAVAITADTTRGALQVQVTGENAKDISWKALVLFIPARG